MTMTRSTSHVSFPADLQALEVYVELPSADPNDDGVEIAIGIADFEKDQDPETFAQSLRALASFIEHHARAGRKMSVKIT